MQILIDTIQKILNQFTDFIPKLIGALVVFFIGKIIAGIVAKVVSQVLQKVGIDKIGDHLNEIDFVKKLGGDLKISVIVAKVLYFFVFLVFITAATEVLGVSSLTQMVAGITELVPKVIVAGIMLGIGVFLADMLQKAVVSACKAFNISSGKLLGNVVFFYIFIIVLIVALGVVGIDTSLLESSFNLIIGGVIFAFAVGYGLASRHIVGNILSSLYSKNRFKPGQEIEVEGVRGIILDIDNTSITLQTGESKTILPLSVFQTKKVQIF